MVAASRDNRAKVVEETWSVCSTFSDGTTFCVCDPNGQDRICKEGTNNGKCFVSLARSEDANVWTAWDDKPLGIRHVAMVPMNFLLVWHHIDRKSVV